MSPAPASLSARGLPASPSFGPASTPTPFCAPPAVELDLPSNFARLVEQRGTEGLAMLQDSHFNKETAFTLEERERYGLTGLLPARVETKEEQVTRCLHQLRLCTMDIDKYVYLLDLKHRNETLFFALVTSHLFEVLPLVYTPTVGEGCLRFSELYRSAHGLFVPNSQKGRIDSLLSHWKVNAQNEVAIIVISDGSRILGLGDLGANGMGIPVGKCTLYVAAGGFHPAAALPVLLDTGTSNQTFLNDPMYIGERHERVGSERFYSLMDEFLAAVRKTWPHCLVQFEDFSNDHCFHMLDRYRHKMLCFNDDIQGTGCVIAAGFLNALKVTKTQDPRQMRVVFLGAGSAGVGVAEQINRAVQAKYGITEEEGIKLFYMVDSKGLLTKGRTDIPSLPHYKLPHLREEANLCGRPLVELLDIIDAVKPHAIIGLSGQPGKFTDAIIRRMGELNDRPIIFPLSNPTKKAECTAAAAFEHTGGRVVFCSGSPFPRVTLPNGKSLQPSQGNNMYIFPGLGFGAWLARCTEVSDQMLTEVTVNLADQCTSAELEEGLLFPPLDDARKVSSLVAGAAIECALRTGLSKLQIPEGMTASQLAAKHMYKPEYFLSKI